MSAGRTHDTIEVSIYPASSFIVCFYNIFFYLTDNSPLMYLYRISLLMRYFLPAMMQGSSPLLHNCLILNSVSPSMSVAASLIVSRVGLFVIVMSFI